MIWTNHEHVKENKERVNLPIDTNLLFKFIILMTNTNLTFHWAKKKHTHCDVLIRQINKLLSSTTITMRQFSLNLSCFNPLSIYFWNYGTFDDWCSIIHSSFVPMSKWMKKKLNFLNWNQKCICSFIKFLLWSYLDQRMCPFFNTNLYFTYFYFLKQFSLMLFMYQIELANV